MSIKPILFNIDMVRALNDGRKTVTRRIFKGAPDRDDLKPYHVRGTYGLIATTNSRVYESTPPCVPGDVLWVRETWTSVLGQYLYKADLGPDKRPELFAWRPSIHMPKKAARIFLRVTDVRAERLQDIDFAGAVAEGVVWDAIIKREHERELQELIDIYFGHEIWDSTVKARDLPLYGYDANPWVWVIEFERCEKPEGWLGT